MFSVIIPNYNRAELVKVAITSVLNQTFQDFEVLVIDDCSTDNSVAEISKIQHPKMRLLELKKNSGAATARNYGVQNAKGDFISFLDSDDFYEPEFLEETNRIFTNSNSKTGLMWTGVRYHYQNKTQERAWTPIKKENSYLTFLHNLQIGSGSGITLKRLAFLNVNGFDESLPAAEDTDFFFRITQKYDFLKSDKILVNVIKKGDDRMSRSFINIAKAYNKFLPQHFGVIDLYPNLQKKYYYKLMWLNFHLGDHKTAKYYYNKIPKEFQTFKIIVIKTLYKFFPLKYASYIHQNLSS